VPRPWNCKFILSLADCNYIGTSKKPVQNYKASLQTVPNAKSKNNGLRVKWVLYFLSVYVYFLNSVHGYSIIWSNLLVVLFIFLVITENVHLNAVVIFASEPILRGTWIYKKKCRMILHSTCRSEKQAWPFSGVATPRLLFHGYEHEDGWRLRLRRCFLMYFLALYALPVSWIVSILYLPFMTLLI
jgi:hypothetical protein